jgi:hypothetical protein
VIVACVLFVALASFCEAKTKWFQLNKYTFEDYVIEFGKDYSSEEYAYRKDIFETRLANIKQHNSVEENTWKKGVNHLSDRNEEVSTIFSSSIVSDPRFARRLSARLQNYSQL